MFTYGPRLDYNSKKQSHNAYSLWKYDPNFSEGSYALKFEIRLGELLFFLLEEGGLSNAFFFFI